MQVSQIHPQIDLLAPESWQRLPELMGDAVAKARVGRDPHTNMLIVLGAPENDAAFRDSRLMATGTRHLTQVGITDGPLYDWWRRILLQSNPPVHTRLRGIVGKAFTPKRVNAMRDFAAEVVAEHLERALEGGPIDILGGIAHEVPVRVISRMLGVPDGDHTIFGEWSNDVGHAFSSAIDGEKRTKIEKAIENFYHYVGELIDERAKSPKDDLLTGLYEAQAAEARLDRDELLALVVNLIFAGHDTTKGFIATAFKLFGDYPDQLDKLRDTPAHLDSAVEEIMRFEPVVAMAARIASEDLEVAGVAVEKGETVGLGIAGANRDPEAIDRPAEFDVSRTQARNLTFGRGAHFCLGASLARLEAAEVLRGIAETGARIDVRTEPIRWEPYAPIRRMDALEVELRR